MTGADKKRRAMLFLEDEMKLIEMNEMFTNEWINWAMSLFLEQLQHIGGLTDFSIGQCQNFDIVPHKNGYIQILLAGYIHWIYVANTIV